MIENYITRSFIMSSPNRHHQVKEDELGETCSRHMDIRDAYKIVSGKLEIKRLFWIPGHRWEVNRV
jgi:hypothetical protein